MKSINANGFELDDLEKLLDTWKHDYFIKQHEGEVRGIDMVRTYEVNQIGSEKKFILKLIRHYKFITFQKEEETLSMTVSVRPSTITDFMNFCPILDIEEKQLTETNNLKLTHSKRRSG